ncbi:hypothetical protein LINPERPRIM_LOCUS18664, partial [Linum perenne]
SITSIKRKSTPSIRSPWLASRTSSATSSSATRLEEDALIGNPSGGGSSSYHHAAGDGDSELGDEDRLSGGGESGTVNESDLSLSDPIPRSGSSMSNNNSSSSYGTTISIKELDLIPEEARVRKSYVDLASDGHGLRN